MFLKICFENFKICVKICFREQVLGMQEETKSKLAEFLTLLPAGLELEDVPDFCSLAQYYSAKTPSSFREVINSYLLSLHECVLI